MTQPSTAPILDADLRAKMLARTGPWLREWLMSVTVESLLKGAITDERSRNA